MNRNKVHVIGPYTFSSVKLKNGMHIKLTAYPITNKTYAFNHRCDSLLHENTCS
jgi:hypothetical protein